MRRLCQTHLAIPGEAEGFERAEDGVGAAGDDARGVQVFHAQQPPPAVMAGVEVTAQGRDERPQVQLSR